MSEAETSMIDFVRELRLRQWARQHWVSHEARRSTWHPIVLEEMSIKDGELQRSLVSEPVSEPLTEPVPADARMTTVIASDVSENSFAPVTDFLEFSDFADFMSITRIGSAYVPLPPTSNWELHSGAAEIPRPHFHLANSELRNPVAFKPYENGNF